MERILDLGGIILIKMKLKLERRITTTDLATIILHFWYNWKAKGVMLTHQNIVSDVLMSAERVPFTPGSYRALSFLPICHIFERMILYLYQYFGVSVYFAESIDKISDNLKEVTSLM